MKKGFLLAIICICFSCKLKTKSDNPETTTTTPRSGFTKVIADTLLTEKISIRAIAADSNRIWYAGNNGKYGYVTLDKSKTFTGHVAKDDLKLEFRSIARTKEHVFILSIGNPGLLYRISKDGKHTALVYAEKGEKVFYDSMQFWNDKEGIAVGDPVENCFSLIITRDGGESWTKINCGALPEIAAGEAFFAASNTNIIIKGTHTWIVSGGKKSSVFYSPDKGMTWKTYATPIVQGEAMTGIFSAAFYDEMTGFAVGGNYEKPEQNFGNKISTADGGKTWKRIAEHEGFGYGSCVQFFPDSKGQELLTVGASGVFYSADQGTSWRKIADYKDLFTLRFLDSKTAVAAGNNKIIRFRFQFQ